MNDILWLTQFVTDQNKGQKMCKTATERTVERAIEDNPLSLHFVFGKYKTPEICKRVALKGPGARQCVLYLNKTQKMCERAVEDNRDMQDCVPNQYKIQQIGEKDIEKDPRTIKLVCDHYNAKQMC